MRVSRAWAARPRSHVRILKVAHTRLPPRRPGLALRRFSDDLPHQIARAANRPAPRSIQAGLPPTCQYRPEKWYDNPPLSYGEGEDLTPISGTLLHLDVLPVHSCKPQIAASIKLQVVARTAQVAGVLDWPRVTLRSRPKDQVRQTPRPAPR